MAEKINVNELVYLSKQRNDEAFELLFETIKPLIYKAYKTMNLKTSLSDDQDMYSSAMMGLFNAVSHYRDDMNTSFSSFATLCITREMANVNRARRRHYYHYGCSMISLDQYMQQCENLTNGDYLLKDERADPVYEMRNKVLMELIDERLDNYEEKMVLKMRLQGYSYQEIADELGIKRKTVDNVIQKIKKKIFYLFD